MEMRKIHTSIGKSFILTLKDSQKNFCKVWAPNRLVKEQRGKKADIVVSLGLVRARRSKRQYHHFRLYQSKLLRSINKI